jgi:hypothetical protein
MILVTLSARWGGGIYTLYALMSRLYAAVVALVTTPSNNAVVTVVMEELSGGKRVDFLSVAKGSSWKNIKLFIPLSLGLIVVTPVVLFIAKMDPPFWQVVEMGVILWGWYGIITLASIYARLIPLVYAFGATIVINSGALAVFWVMGSFFEGWEMALIGLVLSEFVIVVGYYLRLRRA